jgi:hypothetical protein
MQVFFVLADPPLESSWRATSRQTMDAQFQSTECHAANGQLVGNQFAKAFGFSRLI